MDYTYSGGYAKQHIMVLSNYLRTHREQVRQEAQNVRSFEVFDFNYVPTEPLARKEMEAVVGAILRYEYSRIPSNLFVFGSKGSGKTMTMKYLKRLFDAEDGARLLYVNVREFNTSFKILAHLLQVRPRGYSISELFVRFQEEFTSPTVLILDEVDFLSGKDANKEILYLLSRCERNYQVILLANNPKLLDEMEPRTRSSLNPAPMHFRNYNAVELHDILRARARIGLESWNDEHLGRIAAMVTKLANADVRLAIKTLYYTATDDGKPLDKHFDLARRNLVGDQIADLNYNNKLVLKAVLSSSNGLVKDVYDRYSRLCSLKSERPFSYPHFYNNLSYLQSLGLILLASVKQGRTYTNQIQLVFDSALLGGQPSCAPAKE